MLYLELVEDSGFKDRKSAYSLDNEARLDPNFDGLLHRFFDLSFAYTTESCYGVFNAMIEDRRKRHVLGDEDSWYHYEEGYVNFGLDTTPEAREFFERLKNIIRKYRQYTHLAHSYPFHHKGCNLKPNEFHFGLIPNNGIPISELRERASFESWEEAKESEVIRNRVWQELDQLVRVHS